MEDADRIATDAASLLAVPPDRPERLFPHDRDGIRAEWRRLSRAWHPDRNPDPRASWVFAHLEALHRRALARVAEGLWDDGRTLEVAATGGGRYRLRYLARLDTDLGPCLVGRRVLAYVLDGAGADLARRGYERLGSLPFADAAMRESAGRHLPTPRALLETAGARVVVLGKAPDFVPLAGLVAHLGGSVAPEHVAWIVSGLLDFACYLEWAGLAHHAIAPAECLVSPAHHGVAVVGGWWFATPIGAALEVLPARSARLAPPDVLRRRSADPRLDAALVRQTGIDLLGSRAAEAPRAMTDFLALPGTGSAVQDYEDWRKALWRSFGERRFRELAVSPDDVYATASTIHPTV